jgi:hypothetical protein
VSDRPESPLSKGGEEMLTPLSPSLSSLSTVLDLALGELSSFRSNSSPTVDEGVRMRPEGLETPLDAGDPGLRGRCCLPSMEGIGVSADEGMAASCGNKLTG